MFSKLFFTSSKRIHLLVISYLLKQTYQNISYCSNGQIGLKLILKTNKKLHYLIHKERFYKLYSFELSNSHLHKKKVRVGRI